VGKCDGKEWWKKKKVLMGREQKEFTGMGNQGQRYFLCRCYKHVKIKAWLNVGKNTTIA
jgi:hypothetical protein